MIQDSFIFNYSTSVNLIDKVIKFDSILIQGVVVYQKAPFASNSLQLASGYVLPLEGVVLPPYLLNLIQLFCLNCWFLIYCSLIITCNRDVLVL